MIEQHLRSGSTADRVRYLIKDMALYGLATALAPLVGLIAVPLLTHRLTTAEYGAFELVFSYVAVTAIVGGMGQDSAFARYYYEVSDDDARGRIIAQAFTTQGAASLLIMLTFIAIGPWFFADVASVAHFRAIILCAAITVPTVVGFNFTRNVLKWTFLRVEYVIASISYSALVLAGYGVFVGVLKLGTVGAIAAQGLASLIVTIVGLWMLRRTIRRSRDGDVWLPMLKYGLPFVLLGIFSQGLRTLDKTVITHAKGLEAAAVYAVGFRIASLILIVESTFNLAWGPVGMAIYKEQNSRDTYNVALNALACLLSIVAVLMGFGSTYVVAAIAPPQYAGAVKVVKILTLGFVVQSLAGVAAIGTDLAKKPYLRLISWGIGLGIAALLMYLLLPGWGMFGVAAAVAIGYITEAIVRVVCAYAVYELRFDMRYTLLCLAASMIMMMEAEVMPLRGVSLVAVEAVSLIVFMGLSLNALRKQALHQSS